jgi:hypothetical protein
MESYFAFALGKIEKKYFFNKQFEKILFRSLNILTIHPQCDVTFWLAPIRPILLVAFGDTGPYSPSSTKVSCIIWMSPQYEYEDDKSRNNKTNEK